MKDNCQKLFELVESIGETLDGDLHVIDTSERAPEWEGEAKFRVYHKDGYCFDVEKRANYDVEKDKFIGWEYDFFAEWEGFDEIDEKKAINLLKPYLLKA